MASEATSIMDARRRVQHVGRYAVKETDSFGVVHYNFHYHKLRRVLATAGLWAAACALPVSFILMFVVMAFFDGHTWVNEHLCFLWLAFWIGGGVVAGLVEVILAPTRAEVDQFIHDHMGGKQTPAAVRNPVDPERL